MLKFISEKQPQLKGSLLIVSGVSIGNVPALTCDEIIKKNKFQRIAYFQTKHIEPSIGYLPQQIEGGSLGLPVQLYQNGNVLILQFRSYCRFARKRDLAKEIVQQFNKYGVNQYFLISSLPYQIRPDLEIGSVENNVYFKSKGQINGLNLVQNKEAHLLSISHLFDEDPQLETDLMKNGGLANAFYQETQNFAVIFIFSEERQNPALVNYYHKYISKLLGRKKIA